MQKRRLTIGLCSFGMSGKVFHAPLLSVNPDYKLKAIVERSKNEAKLIYPDVLTYHSIDELLEDKEIEIVVVNTPDPTHYEFARQALEAGKHVIVEKPFTLKSEEAYALIDLAKKKNLMLTVFQNRRWDSDFLTVRKILDQKILGRLVEFEAHFDRYRNYIQPDTWKEQPGTGTLYNLGSHLIDQAVQLFGKPEGVMADVRALRSESKVDDSFSLSLYYPEIRVILKVSYLVREPGPKFILNGTLGSFVKPGMDTQEDTLKTGILPNDPNYGLEPEASWGILHTEINQQVVRQKVESLRGDYPAFYSNIYDHITLGSPLSVKPEESALVIRIIEAAFESNRLRKVIEV